MGCCLGEENAEGPTGPGCDQRGPREAVDFRRLAQPLSALVPGQKFMVTSKNNKNTQNKSEGIPNGDRKGAGAVLLTSP